VQQGASEREPKKNYLGSSAAELHDDGSECLDVATTVANS